MLELPHSKLSEQSAIGSVLLDPTRIDGMDICADDFFIKRHKVIWEYLEKVNADNHEWDPIMVHNRLEDAGLLNEIGGEDYLLELQGVAVQPYHSQHYAKEIKEKSNLRKEIDILQNATRMAYDGISQADSVIGSLMQTNGLQGQNVSNIMTEWDKARKGITNTIPTPYPDMDKKTGGIRKGMVTIFTGRSKSGKSMFLSHWYNYLGSRDIPILAVPLEDKYNITMKRMASNFGNYNNNMVDAGGNYVLVNGVPTWSEIQDHQLQKAKDCLERVSKYPVYFWDKKITPDELKSIAMKYKRKYDIQAMFVDGAKDLKRPSGKYNDTGFDEEISQKMCEIAEQLDIAVISIHHLTKLPEDEMITCNHIRGSGNIVGDSRSVYALQSKGIEKFLGAIKYSPDYDADENLTTRIFHCISNNHGNTSMKVINTNLSNCQFIEKTRS